MMVRIAIAYFIIEKKKAAPQPRQAIAQRFCSIGSCGGKISIEWAKHKNLHGLMLETQDNNLIACKFYHNCGFKIGSVDTMLYANFENNFEKAVFWYLRF